MDATVVGLMGWTGWILMARLLTVLVLMQKLSIRNLPDQYKLGKQGVTDGTTI